MDAIISHVVMDAVKNKISSKIFSSNLAMYSKSTKRKLYTKKERNVCTSQIWIEDIHKERNVELQE